MPGLLTAAEIATMQATVASALDQSLPYYDKTAVNDGYGHTTETYPNTPTFMLACNIFAPGADVLQAYADIIAGKRALMLRYLPSSDVREGGRVTYQGVNWRVQPIETAESYTFTNDVLITAVT